eukprot:TCONS_00045956-protein
MGIKILAFFAIACTLGVTLVEGCGGGRRSPPPKCTYRTCHATYGGWESDSSIPAGQCRNIRRRVNHNYQSHTRNGGCPASQTCSQRDQVKTRCHCAIPRDIGWSEWHQVPNSNPCKKKRVMNQAFSNQFRDGSCPQFQPKIETVNC